jgi:hypothetical protein
MMFFQTPCTVTLLIAEHCLVTQLSKLTVETYVYLPSDDDDT